MKQRITYIVPNPDGYNPETLEVSGSSFKIAKVQASKEHRITFGLSELPAELRKAFEQWHELHIRWASTQPYTTIPPFTSRVSPGLHAFFTPRKEESDESLCSILNGTFGSISKCKTPSESFTKMPILSERFSHSASSQFYSFVPDLSNLVSYIQSNLCRSSSTFCKDAAKSLLSASSLDMDYDTISHALIINAFWSDAPDPEGWTETITLPKKAETIEIGVLNRENNPDPEDLQFAGFLIVLGQDTKPKPTLFQAPARHYPLFPSQQTYSTTFRQPTGLHPTLLLTLTPSTLTPPDPTCKLHTHLTLPSYLFIDRYQFSDPLFLTSHNLLSLRSLAGATDLEAPDWVVPQWGSAALFEIAVPKGEEKAVAGDVNVTIPLHLRYLPASNRSHTRVPLPWPVVFWACRAEEGTKMNVNPFDRVHLGYEGLFGPRTRFMHVPPSAAGASGEGNELVAYVDVPILDLRKTGWLEVGTIGTVVVAFLALCWVLFRPLGTKTVVKTEKREEKKKQ